MRGHSLTQIKDSSFGQLTITIIQLFDSNLYALVNRWVTKRGLSQVATEPISKRMVRKMVSKKRAVTWPIDVTTWCVGCFASNSPMKTKTMTAMTILLKPVNVENAAKMPLRPLIVTVYYCSLQLYSQSHVVCSCDKPALGLGTYPRPP